MLEAVVQGVGRLVHHLLAVHPLATINALLNATATVLLLTGYVLVRKRRLVGHKRVMISAFGVSVVFLISYLAYHVWPVGAAATSFQGRGASKTLYYVILISHIVLAMTVPVLAPVTIWLGLKDSRSKHRQVARWTFPIWLYVSITGVVVYFMLYHLFPSQP